jgi:mono/diheme cytochrome c family protein
MRGVAWLALGSLAGCQGSDGGTDGGDCTGGASRNDDILCLDGDAANGATVYGDNCEVCHGPEGAGLPGLGADIRGKAAADTVDSILNPVVGMTDLSGVLSNQEIADVAAHVEVL